MLTRQSQATWYEQLRGHSLAFKGYIATFRQAAATVGMSRQQLTETQETVGLYASQIRVLRTDRPQGAQNYVQNVYGDATLNLTDRFQAHRQALAALTGTIRDAIAAAPGRTATTDADGVVTWTIPIVPPASLTAVVAAVDALLATWLD